MNRSLLNLTDLRPWWLRLLLLLIMGSPLVGNGVLHGQLHKDHFFQDLGAWTAYALFVWLFIALCVGLELLIDWLTVATITSMTILLTGAALRKTGFWEWIAGLVGTSHTDPMQGLMDLIFRFLVIMTATPFALLLISSFPASELMRWVSRRGVSRATDVALIAAMFLRIFQHVGEVFGRCMIAWTEENPTVLLPRYRSDWNGSIMKLGLVEWIRISVMAWSIALATQSVAAIPTIVRDFRRVRNQGEYT